jgi:hypothetical protein
MFWMASMLVYEEASVGCAGVAGWLGALKICEQSALVTRHIHSQTSTEADDPAMSFSRLRAPPPSPCCADSCILHSYPQLRPKVDVIHLLHSRVETPRPIYNMP